jgi:endonuclease-3
LLVAVVLSAQATDKGVNKATAPCSPRSTPGKNGRARRGKTSRCDKDHRLFRTKAKNVIALSRALIEQHGGEVPRDRDALQELPGVGRKTANVVLNVAFGEPTLAVDTHIFPRLQSHQSGAGKNPREVEDGWKRWCRTNISSTRTIG